MRELQTPRLAKRRPEDLQTDGQFAADLAARHGDSWDASEGPRNCIYISKIHLEGVVRTLPELERRYGRCWRHDGVHFCKGIAEVLGNQSPYFLSFEVVGVVIAGGQDIGTEHDAALYFRPETGSARLAVHAQERRLVNPQAIPHAIVARQV